MRVVPWALWQAEHWSSYGPLSAVQYVGVSVPWEREKVRRLAAGGYRVVEVPGDRRSRRTSTAIREALRAGKGWEPLVPATTVEPLRELLARRQAAGLAL